MLGTQLLLEAARKAEVERFHHISTCEVYGDLPLDSDESFTEESPYRPRTPYNASKAAADHYVRAYRETFGLPIDDHELLEQLRAVPVPGEGDPALRHERARRRGRSRCTRRRRTSANGCTCATTAARSSSSSSAGAPGETYNVGSGVEASIEEIADRVLELTGKPESLKTIVPDRPGHDRRYLLDSSKLRRELGWEPEIGFEDGLRETVEWYAANRAWWEPLRERLPGRRNRLALTAMSRGLVPGRSMISLRDATSWDLVTRTWPLETG